MDSAIIQTLGCPLDPDLLKSWERFSLESSNSYTSSDLSESSNEDNYIQHDALLQQFKNISIDDVSDSKYVSAKCSNEITELVAEKKNVTKKLIFVDNTENNENQFYSSSIKNNISSIDDSKSSSDAEDESDDDEQEESVILRERYPNRHNRPENNKQQRTTPFAQKHSKTYRQHLHSNNSEIPENYYSMNNFNASQNCYECSNLNHSMQYNRTYPSCYHNSVYMTHQSFEGIETDQIFNGVIPCAETDQIVNGIIPCAETDQIVNGIIPCAGDQIVNGVIACDMTNEIVDVISYDLAHQNGDVVIPCAVTDQIANGVIPCDIKNGTGNDVISYDMARQKVNNVIPFAMTDQIVNGIVPCSLMDEVFDSVVPSAGDIGDMDDRFYEEINNVSYVDNLEERMFPESIEKRLAVTNDEIETILDSHFEDLNAYEVEYSLKNITSSKSDNFSNQNLVDLIGDNSVIATSTETSIAESRHFNFGTESNGLLSNINVEKTSFISNFGEENNILTTSGESSGYEWPTNRFSNYSNMISKNFPSINSECISPKTSDYIKVSKEIETFIAREHEIVPWEEMKEWVMKEQKNAPQLSAPVTETGWNVLPFVELDSNSISECINTSKCKPRNKKNNKKKSSKSKRSNHAHKPACKAEEQKICRVWGTAKRDELFHSASFRISNWQLENERMRRQIENGELGTKQKTVIHFLKKNRKTKYKGTNLHYAIRSENTEKVFCIVELHKECHGTTNEINLRDSDNKTVLDYSREKGMQLLTAYLEENGAKECGSCLVMV